nr:MAG TPA: Hepatitis E virus ORF-2 (Putative capsid protein) [Caudoviricetes sp.]
MLELDKGKHNKAQYDKCHTNRKQPDGWYDCCCSSCC